MRNCSSSHIALAVLFVMFSAERGDAQLSSRSGTAGALELLIPTDARGLSLGKTGVADSKGINAYFWNPAGTVFTERGGAALIAHYSYFADISVNSAAILLNPNDIGAITAGVTIFDVGDIHETTVDEIEGTGRTFRPQFTTFHFTYARKLTDQVSLGATMKVLHEQIVREAASGIALDFGARYVSRHLGLSIGVAVKNIGPAMRFEGEDLYTPGFEGGFASPTAIVLEAFPLPRIIEAGIAYTGLLAEDQSLQTELSFQDSYTEGGRLNIGSEYLFGGIFALRGGVQFDASFRGARTENLIYSLGGGIAYELIGEGVTSFDYAYHKLPLFDGTHCLSIRIEW